MNRAPEWEDQIGDEDSAPDMVASVDKGKPRMVGERPNMRIARPEAWVREQVFEAVRSAIVSGYFEPGLRLTEKRLTDETGASRTSVREALRHLESHRLIERTENNGLRVAVLDKRTLNNIYDVRSALEPLAVELFVKRASDEDVGRLLDCLAGAGPGIDERVERALQFDRILLEAVGNEVLSEILASLHWRVQVLRRMTMSSPGRSSVAWQQLLDVAEAIEQRSGQQASALMRSHIESARSAALSVVGTLAATD